MKKAVTIYVDDDAGIEEVCATFVLHNSSGDTSVHMINLNWKNRNKVSGVSSMKPWLGLLV
jgi:hypothetical protein